MRWIFLVALTCAALPAWAGSVRVEDQTEDRVAAYAARRIRSAYQANAGYPALSIRLLVDETLLPEAYTLQVDGPSVSICGGDGRGILYGAFELLEQLRDHPAALEPKAEQARFAFRAIKFNLPWESYRSGEALSLHRKTCRDPQFWAAFLDMMAENRYNALTLWSLHPFHLMIRNSTYPEACGLNEVQLAEWQAFWSQLFAMAKERGIETYLVHWNVFCSPQFAQQHGVAKYSRDASNRYRGEGDKAELLKDYNKTTITQVINEYPDLTGFGVSLGERMGGFSAAEREQWILDTVVAGMKAASREVRLIHRLPPSADRNNTGTGSLSTEQLTRRAVESIELSTPILAEVPFNWARGYSSPKLIQVPGGTLDDTYWNPPPQNYQLAWTVRNEDFFCLRWSQPDFIREHIKQNGQPYVGGYFVGSECYIPAKDYMTRHRYVKGYAFERQWLYYMTWGRLLYNPAMGDELFINACKARYGPPGALLFRALRIGSRMPLQLASFYKGTWDFTLYSEGFMSFNAKDNPQRFISIDSLIKTAPLDPKYRSADGTKKGFFELGKRLMQDGDRAFGLLRRIPAAALKDEALYLEVVDAKAWAYLSRYLGWKLIAAENLQAFRKSGDKTRGRLAVQNLEGAADAWDKLVAVTGPVYKTMPLAHVRFRRNNAPDPRRFHWKMLQPLVHAETEKVRAEVGN